MRRRLKAGLLGFILIAILPLSAYPSLPVGNHSRAANVSQRANDKIYSTDIKQLQEKFNQDKGKVRLVLLLSPT